MKSCSELIFLTLGFFSYMIMDNLSCAAWWEKKDFLLKGILYCHFDTQVAEMPEDQLAPDCFIVYRGD
jgi:hypothetical protein